MARKILLADDSVTAQNMGRKILTDAGYDVITVNNGSAALKRVAEQKPDLIVLDVYMPGYSGLEVCVRLKEAAETARIPILLTVGKLEPFKPDEATRVRADGFIVKPFEASELLSALTRLEDRMVPAQAEGGRFGSVSGIERFSSGGIDPSSGKSGDDGDTGWKNRLRFPTKKKKDEPEPEPEPDFVTPSSFRDFRRGGGKPPVGSPPFPLSNAPLAAQEQGIVPDIPRDITPEELDALSELAAKLDGVPAPEQVAVRREAISPEVSPGAEEMRVEAPVPETLPQEALPQEGKIEAEAAISPAEAKNESEIPVAAEAVHVDSVEARLADAPAVDTPPPTVESVAVEEPVVYKTESAVAQEPAPIDREDEPAFASAVSAAEQAQPEAEFVPAVEPASEPAQVDAPAEPPSQIEAPKVEEAAQAAEASAPVAARAPERASTEGSSPSAEELAEALRFLTPSQPDMPQTLAEAGAVLANELSRGAGPRWIAEAMPLSPEEAAGSLEAEMFRTFAPAAIEAAPSPQAATMSGATTEASVAVSEAVGEIHAGDSPSPVEGSSEMATEAVAAPVSVEPEEMEGPKDEAAATTFADAVGVQEVESVSTAAESGATAATETEIQAHEEISSSENVPGGEEAMGKETKGKGGKSTWHQIRSGAPAASDAVEAAKQSEESPKAMAAAAADNGSDASHIASIVDSVLADLRPKIVEEIAKQLAKK